MQDTGDTQYLIPERNFKAFEKTIERLSKKCLKHTGEEITMVVFGYEMIERSPGKFVKCFNVLMNTPKLVTGNWQFVATLDHSVNPEIGNLITSLVGSNVPLHYRSSHSCDHCGINRFRKKTFLLSETTTGEYKQVGSSCLQDFTKIDSVNAMAKAAELISEARSHALAATQMSATDEQNGVRLRDYLATVAMVVARYHQFVSASTSRRLNIPSTASLALAHTILHEPDPQHYLVADHTIEWALALADDPQAMQNDYLYNVNLLARTPIIPNRAVYLAASMVAAANRQESNSEHIGNPGEPITVCANITNVQERSGEYGPYVLIQACDEFGNRLTFTKPKNASFIVGETYRLSAVVNQHDTYKGTKSTRLNKAQHLIPEL